MWKLSIVSDDWPERNVEIDLDHCSIGSAFKNYICIRDPGVSDEHAVLQITSDVLSLEVKAPLEEVRGHPKEEPSRREVGEKLEISSGQVLRLGQAKLTFTQEIKEDVATQEISETVKRTDPKPRWRVLKFGLCALTTCSIIFGVWPPAVKTGASHAMMSSSMINGTPSLIPSKELLLERLSSAGIDNAEVHGPTNALWLKIYVTSLQEQSVVQNSLTNAGILHVRQFVVDSRLVGAINLVLSGMRQDFSIEEVNYGNVRLSLNGGNHDTAKHIKEVLQRDVSNIRSIDILANEVVNAQAANYNISGIWLGRRPYLVLENGETATVGQELSAGVVVLSIEADGKILVLESGIEREINF